MVDSIVVEASVADIEVAAAEVSVGMVAEPAEVDSQYLVEVHIGTLEMDDGLVGTHSPLEVVTWTTRGEPRSPFWPL